MGIREFQDDGMKILGKYGMVLDCISFFLSKIKIILNSFRGPYSLAFLLKTWRMVTFTEENVSQMGKWSKGSHDRRTA